MDAARVAGVSEFITVSLLARKFWLSVVPPSGHGQIHQHLALFNHVALGLDKVFLEDIPHLKERSRSPRGAAGVYRTPGENQADNPI